jgi:hypothetical protein
VDVVEVGMGERASELVVHGVLDEIEVVIWVWTGVGRVR